MKAVPSLFAALPFVLLAACGPAGSAHEDQPAAEPPPGPNDAAVVIDIVGSGTVTYDNTTVMSCAGTGASKTSCPSVRWDGGMGAVTAKADTGWRFTGWSLTYGQGSPNAITKPNDASQTILPGTSVALVATFVPLVHPIVATFTPQLFSTTYRLDIDDPDLDIVKVQWSGPNCGDWDPQGEALGAEKLNHFDMTWHHPHPPCDATTDHKDVTVRATITIKDKTFVCEYKGADTGEGAPCK